MTTTYDAVVVGGRVAGASTAMLLARAGARVVLLDRAPYGSDTLSTHALMRAGVLQLSRWGLLGEVVSAGTPPVRRTWFHYEHEETVQISVRQSPGVDALYAPRRHLIDRILVDAAAAAGVDVRHDVTVVGLTRDPAGRVSGVRANTRHGRRFDVHARMVIGADGIRSVVADGVDAPVERRGHHAGAVLYGYYANLPSVGYEWTYARRTAAGLISTNDGLTASSSEAPRSGCGRCAETASSRRSRHRSPRPLPPKSTGWPRPPGSEGCAVGPGCTATCVARGGRAGHWSATQATSRTRSARTG